MSFEPDYGETLITEEENEALTVLARGILDEPIRKADVYDLEQLIQRQLTVELFGDVADGTLSVPELLSDHFLHDLHRRLYGPVWEWGGRQRSRETNIGIAPERIGVELRCALDDLRYQWKHGTGLTPRALGVSAHAALVRIHPFVDGNGRATRLVADLLFLAAQDKEPLMRYYWNFDRRTYVRLLGEYDLTRESDALVDFIPIVEVSDDTTQP